MKGVQIGNVVAVKLTPSHIEAVAEVADATNLVPQVGWVVHVLC
jgi:hypothetical protein